MRIEEVFARKVEEIISEISVIRCRNLVKLV